MCDDAENHLGPINSFLLPLYTLKTNRLKPSLMTKSCTGTWRVESKLIRTAMLRTKKEKLQTKVGLEDGGSGDLKKYKRVYVCVHAYVLYNTHTFIYIITEADFIFQRWLQKISWSHMPFLQRGLEFCPFKRWDPCTWLMDLTSRVLRK